MQIAYDIIRPFEPFGMPHSVEIKNTILLQEIWESVEHMFNGICAAWRLDKLEFLEHEPKMFDDAPEWIRLQLEQLAAKNIHTHCTELFSRSGPPRNKGNQGVGFLMVVNFTLPNSTKKHSRLYTYSHDFKDAKHKVGVHVGREIKK